MQISIVFKNFKAFICFCVILFTLKSLAYDSNTHIIFSEELAGLAKINNQEIPLQIQLDIKLSTIYNHENHQISHPIYQGVIKIGESTYTIKKGSLYLKFPHPIQFHEANIINRLIQQRSFNYELTYNDSKGQEIQLKGQKIAYKSNPIPSNFFSSSLEFKLLQRETVIGTGTFYPHSKKSIHKVINSTKVPNVLRQRNTSFETDQDKIKTLSRSFVILTQLFDKNFSEAIAIKNIGSEQFQYEDHLLVLQKIFTPIVNN